MTSRERRLPARPPARLRASQRAYARIERTNERTRNARDIAGLARCVLFASSPLSRLGIVLKRTKMRGDMANWTTAFVEHGACGIKAFENHALYRFSAFWLRSSVVCPPILLPRPTLNNIDEVSPEPTVALSGCTGVDGLMDVSCPPIPHPRPTLNNIDEVSPEPTVALSGCTGVDGVTDVSCLQTISPNLPPISPTHSTDSDVPFPPKILIAPLPHPLIDRSPLLDALTLKFATSLPDAEVSPSGYTHAEGCDNPPGTLPITTGFPRQMV